MPKGDGLTYEQRFWSLVDKRSGEYRVVRGRRTQCWEWLGSFNGRGYGYFWFKGRSVQAYKLVHEWAYGPTPGLDRDHLCRNIRCVRPDHIEAVTRREHLTRSQTMGVLMASRERCPEGHEYSHVNVTGSRCCRICNREASRRFYYKDITRTRTYAREWARRKRETQRAL